MPLLSFTENFCDSAGSWHVCAFINKGEAAKVCAADLESGIQKAKKSFTVNQNSGATISAFSGFANVQASLAKLEKTAETLTVLDSSRGAALRAQMDELHSECAAAMRKIKPRLSFRIKIENDLDEMLATVLSEVLESEGFVCSNAANLVIAGKVVLSKSENDVGVFARPSLTLKIQNQQGESLYSYSRQYKKWGHKTEDGAARKAFAEVEKDLRANFMSIFQ
ncbi:MAG: hypothetical protein ACTTKL_00290 [Treponema sp.]